MSDIKDWHPVADALAAGDREKAALEAARQARVSVKNKNLFFGSLLQHFMLEVDTSGQVPTAAITSDDRIIVGVDFVLGDEAGLSGALSQEDVQAVILHECLHAAFRVFDRFPNDRELENQFFTPETWDMLVAMFGGEEKIPMAANAMAIGVGNAAHDFAINEIIVDSWWHDTPCPLSSGEYLYDPRYARWSAERIAEDIRSTWHPAIQQEPEEQGPSPDQSQSPGQSQSQGQIQGKGQGKGQGQDQGQGQGDPLRGVKNKFSDVRPDLAKEGPAQEDEHAKGFDLDDATKWQTRIQAAAQAAEKGGKQGDIPGIVQELIASWTNSQVDWTEELSKVLANGRGGFRRDWRRPHRRSQHLGTYLPHRRTYGEDSVAILWDVSGSMYGREESILSEVFELIDTHQLEARVILCDTRIVFDEVCVNAADVPVVSAGGSDFCPAFARLEDFEGTVLAFTDGMITVPPEPPVLARRVVWIMGEKDRAPTQWGDVITINQ